MLLGSSDANAPTTRETPSNRVDPGVFGVSAGITILFVLWGVLSTDSLALFAKSTLAWLVTRFGWMFILFAAGFVAFIVFIGVSRYGRIRLGADDDRPEISTRSWLAMMFSAGMGIGLMFYGVFEPLNHLLSPPPMPGGVVPEAGTGAAALRAMQYTLFHWAVHPWSMYAVVGLALAYSTYRKRRRLLVSAAFEPLFGRFARGGAGKATDIFAIIATLVGSATSLGLGALQINAGLSRIAGMERSIALQMIIIGVLTVAFILSAVSGVTAGIKWLSDGNMVLAILLAVFLLVVGPTVFILNLIPTTVGAYLQRFVRMTFTTGAFSETNWSAAWTIFYWAWWVSWTPFVGMFIARISRGRTIREFVLGVVLVPSLVSAVWFAIFGGTALKLQLSGAADLAAALEAGGQEGALFATLAAFPFAGATSVVVVILVALFFVSGADAAAVVLGILSSRGSTSPGRGVVITWGVLTGAIAAILLMAGGLDALQNITIIGAAPFTIAMALLCVSLYRDLRDDASRP